MRALIVTLAFTLAASCATQSASTGPAGAASPEARSGSAGVNPYGKYFEGDGLVVEMAMLADKNGDGLNDVLLRITGADAFSDGIDGKVLRYTARPGGTGVDFVTAVNGEDYVRMLSRQAWGTWTFFEVYAGNKSHKVYLDEEKSKQVDTAKLAALLGK